MRVGFLDSVVVIMLDTMEADTVLKATCKWVCRSMGWAMSTMSQKSSLPQAAKSPSHVLMSDTTLEYASSGNALLNRLFGGHLHDVPWTVVPTRNSGIGRAPARDGAQ